jgi:hypothetical protein
MANEKMVEFRVGMLPSRVHALKNLARRLSWERGTNLTWLDLLRSSADWVLASDGERPVAVPPPATTAN